MFNVCDRAERINWGSYSYSIRDPAWFLVPYTESYGSLWKPYEKTIPCLGNRVGSSKWSKWSKMVKGSFSFLWPCDFELGWNSLGAFLSSCAKPRADIRAYTCMYTDSIFHLLLELLGVVEIGVPSSFDSVDQDGSILELLILKMILYINKLSI